MNRRFFVLSFAAAVGSLGGAAGAAAQSTTGTRVNRPYRDDLMTGSERGDLDRSLRNARTDRERERIRSEHRTRMDERARSDAARGVAPYQAPQGGWPDPNAPPPPPTTAAQDAAARRRRTR